MTDSEWQDWIKQANRGDEQAFQTIYEQSKDHVYRTVTLLIGSKQDACDVVSEVYAELFKSLAKYDGCKPFRSWLTGLVIRQTCNWNRKLWRKFRLHERSRLLETEERTPDTEELFLQHEHQYELIALVHKLPYKLRSVVVLRYYQEHTFDEIAELLDIPSGTVKSRHHAAMAKLRKQAAHLIETNEGGLAPCPSKIN
ncbi:sigma-70 family RNA polymerase sigma factor [Paenibacillus oleatilyticus]|uniref:sigma-70 family RNA polymerase sigma factor n=1 Tax=Paenibacillus oleatilyticus TaxID=2594886 RepID=UPI001C1F2C27|nr:sigma-70 family RNA polymerase sigma factor [Paenibacillus oleatilyticus]MBU7317819.1 sigma-70 family RNA polymerase sigma factor [Paenibacillus oleatilyticus]